MENETTPTITDLFTAAAVAYALPITEEAHPLGARINHARCAVAHDDSHASAAWKLIEAVEHLKATNPRFGAVDSANIILTIAADALGHLGSPIAPSNRTIIIAAEGMHDANAILAWLDDIGPQGYREHLVGAEDAAETLYLHRACDFRVHAATLTLSEIPAA